MQTVLVTGGCGFIGSCLVRRLFRSTDVRIVNIDKLTYAGSLNALEEVSGHPRHIFVEGDICDESLVRQTLEAYRPDALLHLAAETHVDRSIAGPAAFVQTNIVGTHTLLEAAREYWKALPATQAARFRFLQVSTDEVYGSLGEEGRFSEESPYLPNSPYAASKAAADHLARAYHRTFGLPTIITHCSNNYGPYQHSEKLIPLMIQRGLRSEPLPVYASGLQVRDWIHVEDHIDALLAIVELGTPGEVYNIGGECERTNLEVVQFICQTLDQLAPVSFPRTQLIRHVADRPGHDQRYAVNCEKMHRQGWWPRMRWESGLAETVEWYQVKHVLACGMTMAACHEVR